MARHEPSSCALVVWSRLYHDNVHLVCRGHLQVGFSGIRPSAAMAAVTMVNGMVGGKPRDGALPKNLHTSQFSVPADSTADNTRS